ncbi:hypothetical protein ACW2Q0_28130 [Nocardia sp. R16R-3T]
MTINDGTDANSTNGAPQGLPLPDFTTTVDWHSAPDRQLQGLAELGDVFQFDVTLYLPWGAAIGTLVSGQEYFERSAEQIRQETAERDQAVQQGFDVLIKGWIDPAAARNAAKKEAEDIMHQGHDLTRFIHLRDVDCVIGTVEVQHKYLRVQLSHVTAWSFSRPLN